MKFKLFFAVAIAVIAFASCRTVRTNPRVIDAQESNILIKPMLAEVEVDLTKKITGTATIRGLIKSKKTPVREIKRLAMSDACDKSGADIVIDPIFKVTKGIGYATVEVTGFYGKYISVETMKAADLEKIELYSVPNSGSGGGGSEGGSVLKKLKKLKK
jgi:hypothetical protein